MTLNLFQQKEINTEKDCSIGNIQYMGTKRKISYELILEMHKRKQTAKYFIDLFGGGGAMSVRALSLGYKVIYNEKNEDLFKFISFVFNQLKDKSKQSKYGILPEEYYEFVSKDEFLQSKKKEHKDIKDEFNLLYYSFGSGCRQYAFSLKEDYKKEAHNLIMHNNRSKLYEERYDFMKNIVQDLADLKLHWREKRLYFANIILKLEAIRVSLLYNDSVFNDFKNLDFSSFYKLSNKEIVESINNNLILKGVKVPLKDYEKSVSCNLNGLHNLECLHRLEILERLNGLENLQRLEVLEQQPERDNIIFYNKSYEKVYLQDFNNDDVIIYCDIPYFNTAGYESCKKNTFDYPKFYNWLKEMRGKGYDVFVSEYTKPENTTEIYSIKKKCLMAGAKNSKYTDEKLFLNIF